VYVPRLYTGRAAAIQCPARHALLLRVSCRQSWQPWRSWRAASARFPG